MLNNTRQENDNPRGSRIILALREGIELVQMIVYRELRNRLASSSYRNSTETASLMSGTILNELFSISEGNEHFQHFRDTHQEEIERELRSFSAHHADVLPLLNDALRMQVLCDNLEGTDSGRILVQAERRGLLLREREIPLPSGFITAVRQRGAELGLIIPPAD